MLKQAKVLCSDRWLSAELHSAALMGRPPRRCSVMGDAGACSSDKSMDDTDERRGISAMEFSPPARKKISEIPIEALLAALLLLGESIVDAALTKDGGDAGRFCRCCC
mmetsp:Transcript_22991/g.58529  ORF Transcript_22991/g.58529 Transcript_22991/m.58529 type:complete len:108 (-) Transcript_22991:216-539(-)